MYQRLSLKRLAGIEFFDQIINLFKKKLFQTTFYFYRIIIDKINENHAIFLLPYLYERNRGCNFWSTNPPHVVNAVIECLLISLHMLIFEPKISKRFHKGAFTSYVYKICLSLNTCPVLGLKRVGQNSLKIVGRYYWTQLQFSSCRLILLL